MNARAYGRFMVSFIQACNVDYDAGYDKTTGIIEV